MGMAPAKLMFVVFLPLEMALYCELTIIIIVTNKINKQGKGKFFYFTINRDHSNKKK